MLLPLQIPKALTGEFQIQEVWNVAWESDFLQAPQVILITEAHGPHI